MDAMTTQRLAAWLYRRFFSNGLAYRGRNWWTIADALKRWKS